MTKGKETLKKNKNEWKEHKFVWEGYTYFLMSKEKNFILFMNLQERLLQRGSYEIRKIKKSN